MLFQYFVVNHFVNYFVVDFVVNVRLLVVYGILLELLVWVYLDGDSMWQRQHATSNTIGPNVGYERGHTVKKRDKGKKGDMGMREEGVR